MVPIRLRLAAPVAGRWQAVLFVPAQVSRTGQVSLAAASLQILDAEGSTRDGAADRSSTVQRVTAEASAGEISELNVAFAEPVPASSYAVAWSFVEAPGSAD